MSLPIGRCRVNHSGQKPARRPLQARVAGASRYALHLTLLSSRPEASSAPHPDQVGSQHPTPSLPSPGLGRPLTGQAPPPGRQRKLYDTLPPLSSIRKLSSYYHPKLLAGIDKALSPAIENRYASAAEWLADLRSE